MIPNNISIDKWLDRMKNSYDLLKQGVYPDVVTERFNAGDLMELVLLLNELKLNEERKHA